MHSKIILSALIVFALTAFLSGADDDLRFGLDLSLMTGSSSAINLNKTPAEYDLGESFIPRMPSFFVCIGLGTFGLDDPVREEMDILKTKSASDIKKVIINRTLAFEYGRMDFEGDSVDLALNSFGLVNRMSIHPLRHLSVISGSVTGLFVMAMNPELQPTGTFMDYTGDESARLDKAHFFNSQGFGLGLAIGKTPRLELSLEARVDTYYPRFVFWKEFMRSLTYTGIRSAFNQAAQHTGVWALKPAGDAVATLLEVFNLNFYPESVGETHQHFLTPGFALTIHF
ncbi:hypothetical protein JW877_09830 [bacterium]|nr:hypothetical protein [bacterium]